MFKSAVLRMSTAQWIRFADEILKHTNLNSKYDIIVCRFQNDNKILFSIQQHSNIKFILKMLQMFEFSSKKNMILCH